MMKLRRQQNLFCVFALILPIASFVSVGGKGGAVETKRWVISKSSSLSVNGSTNINKFSCVIPAYDQTDTLKLTKSKTGGGVILSGTIGLSISSFDCHNSGMTKQLRKTLNEKQFPVLRIRFLTLSKNPVLTTKPEQITGLVEIEIAGISKRFEVNYQITQNEQKNIHLLGSRDIDFSEN
jgi:hypothetical protein